MTNSGFKNNETKHAIQLRYFYELLRVFPNSNKKIIPNHHFSVRTVLRPDKHGENYVVEFFCGRKEIRVYVYGLKLTKKSLEQIPHIYPQLSKIKDDKLALCLFLPSAKEFIFGDSLKETIIPWTKEWLHFYELFKMTGVWFGNGKHPTPQN